MVNLSFFKNSQFTIGIVSLSGIVRSLIATMRNFGQVTGTAVGILLFQIGASRFGGNYDSAMNVALTFSVVIGIVTIILLML
ncbi:hypothetical protein [Oceanobacillus alkalisoli]|uniref:hypothetical protein n=1 Tax=Oceanobacillus alkalisoli TaxID=2925113 RepID=UPI001EF14D58|nr:hypothetical protein [Oceanobacillus alkalisoli]MCF3943183.1 hypothetical protein [Oceanobacillus alkalisoli]MCG5103937.1 hypothetical protein [Oceanobacillus alkalisoli]